MTKKQTAVEWLFNQIKKSSQKKDNINNDHLFFYRILGQAIQMEKQQILDAIDNYDPRDSAEQYYNETYKSK